MRQENEIFEDLAKLCTSPGYVHAIAFLCFRDSYVRFSDRVQADDLKHMFSDERLIRTEITTLIGLLVKEEIDFSFPGAEKLQEYIDQTDKLLKEIHESMAEPMWKELIAEFESGKLGGPIGNPFQKGSALREPIFYSGESAYSFQYRDFSIWKYQADDTWLLDNKGFSISAARDVAQAVMDLQNERIAATVESLVSRPLDQWSLLPGFTFTETDISVRTGLERTLVAKVLNAFTLPSEDKNLGFRALHDFNALAATPLIRTDSGKFLLFEQYSLLQSLYESPFYWMGADKAYVSTAMENRGRFLEKFATERLESVFGKSAVYPNVILPGTKGKDKGEIDVLVVFGDRAIILQAKSKRLTLEARKGNDNVIRSDFAKSVQSAYDQAYECAGIIREKDAVALDLHGNKIVLPILKEIYIFCVVADDYPALSFQARQFLTYQTDAVIPPPFILDVFTLDAMSEMLDTPLWFLSYVNRRTRYHEKIHVAQELVVLSYHLKYNLWFENDLSFVHLQEDLSADLDLSMTVRRQGISGPRTPEGYLTFFRSTTLGAIIGNIERRADPRTIELGFVLLKLSGTTIKNISREIERMAALSRNDGQSHDLSMPMGDAGEGLTIHCNRDAIPVAASRLEEHCQIRKYVERADRWFGICLWPDGGLRFGINLDLPWQHNSELEDLLRKEPLRGHPVMMSEDGKRKKIGRNDPCPCRSGKKYKKCHGRS